MMIRHVLGTSTSRMAFRLIFLELDLDPSVATSLISSQRTGRQEGFKAIIPYGCYAPFARGEDYGSSSALSVFITSRIVNILS